MFPSPIDSINLEEEWSFLSRGLQIICHPQPPNPIVDQPTLDHQDNAVPSTSRTSRQQLARVSNHPQPPNPMFDQPTLNHQINAVPSTSRTSPQQLARGSNYQRPLNLGWRREIVTGISGKTPTDIYYYAPGNPRRLRTIKAIQNYRKTIIIVYQ